MYRFKHSKELFSQILNNPNIAIMATDKNREIVFVNDLMCSLFEYSVDEFIGQNTRLLYTTDEAYARFGKEVVSHAQLGENLSIEYQFVRKNGELLWFLISSDLIENDGIIFWTAIDITDRVAKEKEIFHLNERMKIALSGYNAGVWEWNLLDDTVYASLEWKKMLGYSDELPNLISSWKDRVHPDDLETIIQQIKDSIAVKAKYIENVHRLRHKDGHWIWVLSRASITYEANGVIRLVGIHTDISEQKELELKYAHQAQIIEQVHDIVISLDLDGKIISWNNGAKIILGYTAQEIVGKHISTLKSKDERETIKQNIQILMQEGEHAFEANLIKKSGKKVNVEVSLSLLRDEKDRVIGMIGYAQDITKRKKAEKELQKSKKVLVHLAYHDTLTGLPNRLLFNDRLNQMIEKSTRNDLKFAVLFLDLDYFKEINDSFGHEVGDEVLKVVAKRFKERMRKEDTLARLGGDEFSIIMEDVYNVENASVLAEKILQIFKKPIEINKNSFYISCSIGISLFPNDGKNSQNLLKYADAAMYKAKQNGRNAYVFYSKEMTELAIQKVMLESELRAAFKNNELVVYYQPQIDIKEEKIVGMEALVRWHHPKKGMIPPSEFIPLAEATGLIVELDKIVMKIAIKQLSYWYAQGFNPGILALNLSVKQLEKKDFIDNLQAVIAKYKCNPKHLELEVTEGGLIENPAQAIKILQKISDIGLEIAIDDVGTGYSSLAYLKKLPINKLKIDKSFVDGLPNDEEDCAITKAIIVLAQSLKLKTVAEGVEQEQQKQFLATHGCDIIQGYLYSKPLCAKEFEAILVKNNV